MEEQTEQKTYNYGKRPLWQWIVIYLIIGGLIYAAVYYLFLAKKGGYNYNQPGQYQTQPTAKEEVSPKNVQASPSAQKSQNTITLNANGFSPATLTVKVGSIVTWLNKSGQTATVHSDPHPIHTAYPLLNLGSFPDGSTLSLKFGTSGTYKYHNHYNASERGAIIVE